MTTKKTSTNARLHGAKRKKNGEFYTQLSDIEEELCHYEEAFRGKTVLCNCDDPRVSNFFKYFCLNFEYLGLKRVITTCYKNQNPDLFSTNAAEKACYLIYDGNNGGNMPDWEKVEVLPLKGDGSFSDKECIALLEQADIVVTNPPFALFRDFLSLLLSYNKQFIIIGNKNAITYKEVFPLIKDGKLWLGHRSINKDMWFILPDDAEDYERIVDGKKMKHESAIWFTNIDYRERHEPMILGKSYSPELYPKFDNYDAINVDKVIDIPKDYYGVMGVPITFLGSYCPEQFEIVEFRKGNDGKDLVYSKIGGVQRSRISEYSSVNAYCRIDEQSERHNGKQTEQVCTDSYSTTSIPGMIKNAEGKINGKPTYARIIIRRLR